MDETTPRPRKRRTVKEQKARPTIDVPIVPRAGKTRPASPPGAPALTPPPSAPPQMKPVATAAPPPGPSPRTSAPISLSALGDLLPRRIARMHGLAIVALLSGATLAAALMLARPPAPSPADPQARDTGAINFQLAGSQAMTLQGLASQSAQTAPDAKASEPQPTIRIVDQPSEKVDSCEGATWPYIDQRCLTTKDETGNASTTNDIIAKIGPKPIDARPPLAAPDRDIPIGSMSAIAPAYPQVSTTDGLSSEPPEARIVEPVRTEPIAEPAVKARKPARVRHAAADRSERVSASRKKTKEKKYRDVADARRRYYDRPSIDREPGPSFFFPFGLFSQAR